MPKPYRLRAGVRDVHGEVVGPIIDVIMMGESDETIIETARKNPVDFFIGAGDYAWLTDESGKTIWSLTLEESV